MVEEGAHANIKKAARRPFGRPYAAVLLTLVAASLLLIMVASLGDVVQTNVIFFPILLALSAICWGLMRVSAGLQERVRQERQELLAKFVPVPMAEIFVGGDTQSQHSEVGREKMLRFHATRGLIDRGPSADALLVTMMIVLWLVAAAEYFDIVGVQIIMAAIPCALFALCVGLMRILRLEDRVKNERTEILARVDLPSTRIGAQPIDPAQPSTPAHFERAGGSSALGRPPVDRLFRDLRFTQVLVEYYAYGLAQAKRAASASLMLSIFGALVLLAGVVSAFVRSYTAGTNVTSTVVVSTSGVLTTGLGTLMHRQASRALKHMEDQTAGLRADRQADRDQETALDLLAAMPPGDTHKARIQAAIILKLTGATLPEGRLAPAQVPQPPLLESHASPQSTCVSSSETNPVVRRPGLDAADGCDGRCDQEQGHVA